jgi:hypothetical protein
MTLDISALGDNGISAATLTLTAQGADTLQFVAATDIDSADLLAPFSKLILMDGAACRFVGWLDRAPRSASGTAQSRAYSLTGPMRWFDRTPWTNEMHGGRAELSQVDGSNVLPLDTTIRAILDFVRTKTSNAISYVDADLDDDVFQFVIPPETRIDSKCGDLLRRALKFVPTVVFWWDYTTTQTIAGHPVLIPTIRFADADKVYPDKTLSETAYDITQAAPDPQYDLLYNKVRIYWLGDGTVARTDELTATSGDAFDIVAATPAAARTLVQSFETGMYNVPAEGIAARLLKHASRLHVNCSPTMLGLDWTHKPGQLWSYDGILASAYQSFCYQVTRDLFQLTQTLSLGVPPEFSAYKLSDGNNSNPPPKNPAGSGHPFQGIDASDPNSSSKKVRIIYGTVSGTAPNGFSDGDDPAFILDASGSKVVYICVTIDATDGSITSRTVGQASSMPSDGDTTFYNQLCSYTIESSRLNISQAVAGSLSFQACPYWYSNPRSWTPAWGAV